MNAYFPPTQEQLDNMSNEELVSRLISAACRGSEMGTVEP